MRKLGVAVVALAIAAFLTWLKLERGIFPRRSTRDYWRLSSLPVAKKIEGYIYGARTSTYLKPATWKWLLRRGKGVELADTYHAKVVTSTDAAKLIAVNGPVALSDLEHIIPYPVARDIILRSGKQQIAVLKCPCREQKKDACEPKEVCLVVGEPFASFVVEHQPSKARIISIDEALEIIEAEEKRGHIHTAWFKDAMHNRFYAICNCCRCCCLGMQSFFRGAPRLIHSGYRPSFDYGLCSGCKNCEKVCQFSAIRIDNTEKATLDGSRCMGCGLCVSHCPQEAIALELANDEGIPLAIDMLLQNKDIKGTS